MNDENGDHPIVSYNPPHWLGYKDKKGRFIIYASALIRLAEHQFSDDVNPGWIELDKIYKWGKLIQSGYTITFKNKPTNGEIVGRGYVVKLTNAVRISDIQIQFDNSKTASQSLISYLNYKKLDLEAIAERYIKGKVNNFSNLYYSLSSATLSKLFSVGGAWNQHETFGSVNIFESDELLDQLTIYILLLHARWSSDDAIDLLKGLLHDHVKKLVYRIFQSNIDGGMDSIQDRMGEAMDFVGLVLENVENEEILRSRFRFPLSSRQSLLHFLVAPYKAEGSFKGWTPKIQQYFSEQLRKKHSIPLSNLRKTGEENGSESMDFEEAERVSDDFDPNFIRLSVDKALESLSTKQRSIFNFVLEGYSQREIAKRLGVSEVYISQVMGNCRKKIKEPPRPT